MLTNAVALSSKILFGYVHLLVPINNTGNNHMKLRKLVVAVGLSICSPFCFSDIITSGDVSVIDGAFNSYPVDIGPGDTHLGPDLGVFLISTVDQQSSLTVNNGSTLSGAQLVAMSEVDSDGVPIPGVEPAQIIIDGVGSSIQLYHSGPGSAGQIDLSSQGSANLSIVNGGALVFNVSDECGAFECNLGYLSNAAGTNTNIVVSGEGSLLDLAHNAQQRIAIGTASYQVWETSNFGYPGGETNISISIAEGARFETSIAEVSPGWTGPDNTGTESINASIEVTGSGSTWYSESIFLGFGDGAENMSGLSANLTVSDGGVIDSNIFIGEAGELAGDGTVSGDIENWGGVVSPGLSPGNLMIDGDFYMESGSILLEIGGIESGMFDALFVDGSINIMGGEILIDFIDGFLPSSGDSFDFLNYSSEIFIDSDVIFGINGYDGEEIFNFDRTTGRLTVDSISVDVDESASIWLLSFIVVIACFARNKTISLLVEPCSIRAEKMAV
tara:strand:- start:1872 stop:3374 length:1503 start_codon:yes stop_codon:yes gene_type:complete